MFIVLASGPKLRDLKPVRGDGFLRAIKIRSTPSFGGEVTLLEEYGLFRARFYGTVKFVTSHVHICSQNRVVLSYFANLKA
jgi:hypothetical protein